MKLFIKSVASFVLSLFLFSAAYAAPVKVGFIYVGPVSDHGWTYMHDQGRQSIDNAFGDQVETFYIENVKYGDKRVILVNGKAVGAVNRIPRKGAFKANLHLGGTASKTTLSKKENDICQKLASVLKENKLFFVGIDLIDQKLTEINVTSPTGLIQLKELYKINISKLIWEELFNIV